MQEIDSLIYHVSLLVKANLDQEIIFDPFEKNEAKALKITHYTDDKSIKHYVVLSKRDIEHINNINIVCGVPIQCGTTWMNNPPYQNVIYKGLAIIRENLFRLLIEQSDILDKELLKKYIDDIEQQKIRYMGYQ